MWPGPRRAAMVAPIVFVLCGRADDPLDAIDYQHISGFRSKDRNAYYHPPAKRQDYFARLGNGKCLSGVLVVDAGWDWATATGTGWPETGWTSVSRCTVGAHRSHGDTASMFSKRLRPTSKWCEATSPPHISLPTSM